MDVATLGLRVDANGAIRGLDQFSRASERAARRGELVERMARRLHGALFALGGALGLRQLIQYADTWRLIEGRLRLVTTSSDNLAAVQAALFQSAQRTRTAFEATATLYARVARNAAELGRSQQDLLRFTELVQKSIRISGATQQEAAAGTIQLSQALASGALRGEEFRSVAEQMPDILLRIQQATGKTAGELRAMAFEGQLTADLVIGSLLQMSDAIDREFSAVPVTFGQAFTTMSNVLLRYIGAADTAGSISQTLAGEMVRVAEGASANEEIFRLWSQRIGAVIQLLVFLGRTAVNVVQNVAALIKGILATINLTILQLVDSAVRGINLLIDEVNKVPGVSVQPLRTFEAEIRAWQQVQNDATADFRRNSGDIGDAWANMIEAFRTIGDTSTTVTANLGADLERVTGLADRLTAALGRVGNRIGLIARPEFPVNLGGVLRLPSDVRSTGMQQAQAREQLALSGIITTPVSVRGDRSRFEAMVAAALDSQKVRAAVNNLGNAIGSLSEKAARGVQGIRAIVSSIDAFAANVPASGQSVSLSGGLNLAAASIGAISAGVQLLGGIIDGIRGRDREAERAHRAAVQALELFRSRLEGFDPGSASSLGAAGQVVAAVLNDPSFRQRNLLLTGAGGNVPFPDRAFAELDAFARRFGLKWPELVAIADEFGIKLTDANGRIDPEQWRLLQQYLDSASRALVGFRNTLTDLTQERDIGDRLRGVVRTPQQMVLSDLDILKSIAPQLFERYFAGVDLSDMGAVQQAAIKMFEDFSNPANEWFADLMGGLDRTDLLNWFGLVATSFGELDRAVKAATGAVTDIPKAVNLALYERQFGTGVVPGADGSMPGAGILPPGTVGPGGTGPGPTDTGPGGRRIPGAVLNFTFEPGSIVTDAQNGEELLEEFEDALNRRASSGGYTILRGVRLED